MQSATVYKIHKKGLLLFGSVKTVSGFGISTEPYIQIAEDNTSDKAIADAIKAVISNDDSKRVVDPKNWAEYSKEFLKKTGLKSSKELNQSTTLCCMLRQENNNIVFIPTKHAEKPDEGFVNKSKDEPNIFVSVRASSEEIAEAFKLALSKCE
jgi:hypothetical protein